MVLGEYEIGKDEEKILLHAKRWGVYMREKILLNTGGYSMEV